MGGDHRRLRRRRAALPAVTSRSRKGPAEDAGWCEAYRDDNEVVYLRTATDALVVEDRCVDRRRSGPPSRAARRGRSPCSKYASKRSRKRSTGEMSSGKTSRVPGRDVGEEGAGPLQDASRIGVGWGRSSFQSTTDAEPWSANRTMTGGSRSSRRCRRSSRGPARSGTAAGRDSARRTRRGPRRARSGESANKVSVSGTTTGAPSGAEHGRLVRRRDVGEHECRRPVARRPRSPAARRGSPGCARGAAPDAEVGRHER